MNGSLLVFGVCVFLLMGYATLSSVDKGLIKHVPRFMGISRAEHPHDFWLHVVIYGIGSILGLVLIGLSFV